MIQERRGGSRRSQRTVMAVILAVCGLMPGLPSGAAQQAGARMTAEEDPYLWLEDVDSDTALDWVRTRNAETQSHFDPDPEFGQLRQDLLAILDSDARIPYVAKHGSHYYNFWRDAANERGVWRRTTLAEYRKPQPRWETVLDLDALAAAEGENWVWAGASCLPPDHDRCLIALSRGGADANVTREFDIAKREFVTDGFVRPEAKGGLQWIDRDTVFVYTDFGDGTMTGSGYPRIVKRWQRGTPLNTAPIVYEGRPGDLYISARHDHTPGFERDLIHRAVSFYEDELFLRGADGSLVRIPAPDSAGKTLHREWLLLELREPLVHLGQSYPAGALLAARLDDVLSGTGKFEVLFTPTANAFLAGFSRLRDHIVVNILEDVQNRLLVLTPGEHGWSRTTLEGRPDSGSLLLGAIDERESNAYFLIATDYVTPTTLYHGEIGTAPEPFKQLPALYDASGLAISQHFATSADGTRVPYFLVAREDLKHDGNTPTLLYGYGGFEVSLTPAYDAIVGRAWTSQGGAYAVANIRGGGEYGPGWHQAALTANRKRAFEDFAAVARDLAKRRVTRPARLGIRGGSNGGLLVGNMLTRYPELFAAAHCEVPLLDMKRYHRLLAGASWMAEYGDPDDPDDWAFIRDFSPYHNIDTAAAYPPVLFTTSTRDDRVHPGHARKMAARMRQQGHEVLYYENIEGGHGGAANNRQSAYMAALAYTFLKQRLFPR